MRYTELNTEDVTQHPQWNGFIGKNKKNQIISFRKIYFDLTQDIETAILLEEICYWYGKPVKQTEHTTRLRIKQDGFLWLAKQRADWFDLVRLSLRKYDRAIQKLKTLKYVATKVTRFRNKSQTLIRLTNLFIEDYNKEITKNKVYTTKNIIDMDAKAKDIQRNISNKDEILIDETVDQTNPDLRNGKSDPFLIYGSVDQGGSDLRNGKSLYTSPLNTTPLNKKKNINFSKQEISQKEELKNAINFYNKFWDDFEREFTKSSWSPILKFYNNIPDSDIRLNYFLYLLNIQLNELAYSQVFELWNDLDCTNRNSANNSYNRFIALVFTQQKKCSPIKVSTVDDVKGVIYALHNFMNNNSINWPVV